MQREATAVWQGTGMEGTGALTTGSGAMDAQPYSFRTRFGSEDGRAGTNPEELVAAAHAGCFAMALSFVLGGAGFTPEELRVRAVVSMAREGVHWSIPAIRLELRARVAGIDPERFRELAEQAKDSCPISKVLNAEITLDAELVA